MRVWAALLDSYKGYVFSVHWDRESAENWLAKHVRKILELDFKDRPEDAAPILRLLDIDVLLALDEYRELVGFEDNYFLEELVVEGDVTKGDPGI